jgi:hypothetical protein
MARRPGGGESAPIGPTALFVARGSLERSVRNLMITIVRRREAPRRSSDEAIRRREADERSEALSSFSCSRFST